MPRTVDEIALAALSLDDPKPKPDAPIVITTAEAKAIVAEHQADRERRGRPAPTDIYLMKKIKSGKARIHGHRIEVNDNALESEKRPIQNIEGEHPGQAETMVGGSEQSS